jgi:transglutaminase-like putative cysteine protease
MRFSILHRTHYRYSAAVLYSIQQLRLTPRDEPHQRTLRWRVKTPETTTSSRDAFGNLMHTLTLTRAHDAVAIEARGEVEIDPLHEGRLEDVGGSPPPLSFLAATPLTAADAAVRDLTARHWRGSNRHALLDLAQAVAAAIDYKPGATEVTSTAAEALSLGSGVCQDHAHVFIAACRLRGVPARYVSGYVHPGDAPHAASHAWADAYVDGDGWISIDVTHRRFASDNLCRLAVGRDYATAGPVRGVRVGGGDESLEVRVNIRPFSFRGPE